MGSGDFFGEFFTSACSRSVSESVICILPDWDNIISGDHDILVIISLFCINFLLRHQFLCVSGLNYLVGHLRISFAYFLSPVNLSPVSIMLNYYMALHLRLLHNTRRSKIILDLCIHSLFCSFFYFSICVIYVICAV